MGIIFRIEGRLKRMFPFTAIAIFLFLLATSSWAAHPLDVWQVRAPGHHLSGIAWNGRVFVAVGQNGVVQTSADGITWASNPVPLGVNLLAITARNDLLVTVGSSGAIFTSTDGIGWMRKMAVRPSRLNGIADGNGRFVSVGDAGAILTSTDAISWSDVSLSDGSQLLSVAYGNGQFVAVGAFGTIVSSQNGSTWIKHDSPTTNTLRTVVWNGAYFIAAGDFGKALKSIDGIEWTSATTDIAVDVTLRAGTWGGNRFILVGANGQVWQSEDGRNWFAEFSRVTSSLNAIAWNGQKYVAVGAGGSIIFSPDGVSWTRAAGVLLRDVVSTEQRIIAVGDEQRSSIMTSLDGAHWTLSSLNSPAPLFDIARIGDRFIAVGGTPTVVWTSTGGESWIRSYYAAESQFSPPLQAICVGPQNIVALGMYGTVLTSFDGLNWTNRSSRFETWNAVDLTWGGKYVAVGMSSSGAIVLTSQLGSTWAVLPIESATVLRSVCWNGIQFVAVGDSILTSPDATRWTLRSTGNNLNKVSWGAGYFVAVGADGVILSSKTGTNWTTHSSGTANDLHGITWMGDRFTAVGEHGTILQSASISPEISLWNPTFDQDGFRFKLSTEPEKIYRIEASSDLREWFSLGEVSRAFHFQYDFGDTAALTNGRRFYRVIFAPR